MARTKTQLTKAELEEVAALMRLGDSEQDALWAIEHIYRPRDVSSYRIAYEA